jgi:hypothetical protein
MGQVLEAIGETRLDRYSSIFSLQGSLTIVHKHLNLEEEISLNSFSLERPGKAKQTEAQAPTTTASWVLVSGDLDTKKEGPT